MNEKNKIQILIIDLGSQYTQIIRRSLRYLGFYSIILPPEKSLEWIKVNKPKGIILSGGSSSVYDIDAPKIPKEIVNLNIPILGICYGMQWLAYINDKDTIEVKKEGKSYGPVQINFSFKNKSKLFEKLKENINAWSSHGDSVKKAPKDFIIIATSQDGKVIEAIECEEKKLWAVQFHPEVEETQDENIILNN
ncbi:GMP synthase (glutamine-hydrolyzing), partial [Candidatus Nomurabacteria bacterium CG_4_10_14_0_2_um_filter_33_9]